MRFFLAVFTGLMLISCQQDSSTLDPAQAIHEQEPNAKTNIQDTAIHVFERNDAVWIKLSSGKLQRLTDRGKGYSISIAPDGHWITIDKAILSNLQVTKLFQRQPNATYLESKERNLTTLAWNQWSKTHGIHSDDVVNPRTRTISWSQDSKRIVIELTGLGPDGEYFEHTLEIDLIEH